MEKIWTTKDGKDIPYKDLEDSHLLNVISFIEKKAKEGVRGTRRVLIDTGYQGDSYMPDFVRVEDIFFDEVVKKHMDYKGLLKEAKKRKLLTNNK